MNQTSGRLLRILDGDLRAIVQDAVDDVRRVVIEEFYPHGPGYEARACVGGDYVPAEEVDALVAKIMAEVLE